MKEYIERQALKADLQESYEGLKNIYKVLKHDEERRIAEAQLAVITEAILRVKDAPAADVVSKELYEQIKWERDAALAQLKDYGVSLGEKADVVEVRHGRWDDSGRYKFPNGETAVCCTECGCALRKKEYENNNWFYCPVCGAKMDKEE